MASERATFAATLDLRDVDANLKRTRANIDNSIGGTATRALGAFDQASGKAAKAIGGLSFAMGSMGKASSGAMRDLGDIAMILSSGGALGIALTGATVLFAKLYEVVSEASERQKALKQTTDALHTSVKDAADKAVKPMLEALKSMNREIETFGKNSKQIAVDDAAMQTAMLQNQKQRLEVTLDQKRADLTGMAERQTQIARTGTRAELIEAIKDGVVMKATVELLETRLAATQKSLTTAEVTLRSLESARIELETKQAAADEAADAAKKGGKKGGKEDIDPLLDPDWQPMEQAFQKRIDAAQEVQDRVDAIERAQREKEGEENIRFWREQDDMRIKMAKEREQELARVGQESAATWRDQAESVAGIAASASMQLVEDMATNQRYALDLFAANILSATGTHLVGTGTKLLGEAVFSALTPGGQPLSAAQVAGATALIGTGVAMGGLGAGWSSNIATTISAEDDAFKEAEKAAEKAKKDRGVPLDRRAGGGGRNGSGGGGVTIVNQWGVAGPTADDQARAMRRVIDRVNDGRF